MQIAYSRRVCQQRALSPGSLEKQELLSRCYDRPFPGASRLVDWFDFSTLVVVFKNPLYYYTARTGHWTFHPVSSALLSASVAEKSEEKTGACPRWLVSVWHFSDTLQECFRKFPLVEISLTSSGSSSFNVYLYLASCVFTYGSADSKMYKEPDSSEEHWAAAKDILYMRSPCIAQTVRVLSVKHQTGNKFSLFTPLLHLSSRPMRQRYGPERCQSVDALFEVYCWCQWGQ